MTLSRIKLLGLCLMAILALSAVVSSAAFAAEEKTKMLPESGVKFTGKGGEGNLQTLGKSLEIKCKKATGSGTIDSANLGKYETDFKECSATLGGFSLGPCSTAGDASGIILNKGTYHFWLAKELLGGVNTLVGALAELPEESHITCTSLGTTTLILVKGCVAALAKPLNVLTSKTEDVFATTGTKGDQLITKVLPAGSTTEESCILLSAEGTGAFEGSALTGIAENEGFKSGETNVTVLLMNPEAKE